MASRGSFNERGEEALSEDDKGSPAKASTTREPSRLRGNSAKHGNPRAKSPPRDIGGALRSVYQTTIGEDIPSEMLDLLGKLD